MKRCSGANCPMQIGYHVEKCTFGEDCPNYTEENIELLISDWALRGIRIASKYDLSTDKMADYFKASAALNTIFETAKGIQKGKEET